MSTSFDTPILFLIFNRPAITEEVFKQISLVKPRYLYVGADGPRIDKPNDFNLCTQTRNIISKIDWDCEVKTLFREGNLGCGKAVSTAITWFFEQVEYGIILEDDCLPDLSFFPYCKELLEKYKTDEQVMLIGGNNFQNEIFRGEGSYYFTNYAHIWGWASWRRAWYMHDEDYFDYDPKISEQKLAHVFNSNSEKKYWNKIFAACKKGLINTWDYQWLYYIWKNKGLSISPKLNLVVNLGFHNNSTHYFLNDSFKVGLKCNSIGLPLKHTEIKIDRVADIFTYTNLFSHSIGRLIRLIKENRLGRIVKYYLKK